MVIMITDENYLIPLEMKMAFSFSDVVSIEIISSKEYFGDFFSKPQTIDVLVIEEEYYDSSLYRHNIKKIVVLSETVSYPTEVNSGVIHLFKYSNIKVLLDQIVPKDWGETGDNFKKTRLITVLSAVGGSGCSSVALGLSLYLAQCYKRVLYLNAEEMQNFGYYISHHSPLPLSVANLFKQTSTLYSELKSYIVSSRFDYLPQIQVSRESLGISRTAYSDLAKQAVLSGDYDYVVLELGTTYVIDEFVSLDYSDKSIIVTNQDEYSAYKTDMFFDVIHCKNSDKVIFACNRFDTEQENVYSSTYHHRKNIQTMIGEYIEMADTPMQVEAISKAKGIQRIAVSLL